MDPARRRRRRHVPRPLLRDGAHDRSSTPSPRDPPTRLKEIPCPRHPAALHHLALTVTDLDASVAWYESVFDVHPVMDVPHPGGVGKILAERRPQLMIVLHRHDANDGRCSPRPRPASTTPGSPSPRATTWSRGRTTSRRTASCAPNGRQATHPVADRGRALRLGPRLPRPGQHPARALRPGAADE